MRMQEREEEIKKFDEKVRPFVDALAYAQTKNPATK